MSTPVHNNNLIVTLDLLLDQVFICFVLFGINSESKQVSLYIFQFALIFLLFSCH